MEQNETQNKISEIADEIYKKGKHQGKQKFIMEMIGYYFKKLTPENREIAMLALLAASQYSEGDTND